jgi:D-alanyl-D-alanine carboxypeptidase
MKLEQIQRIQRIIGVTPDGFWGPKSIQRCRDHLKSLMPIPNPWPFSTQEGLRDFYGEPGDESNLVTIEFPIPMFYEKTKVTRGRCHKKVAASLTRVLWAISARHPGQDVMDTVEDYSGIYNFRLKRGGTNYSVHAWGAAIDLDADDNTFKDPWPLVADMSFEIMEEFAKEGWQSAGAFWGYDAMHFEATRPRA